MIAGVIPVDARGDTWTLQANRADARRRGRRVAAELAAMLVSRKPTSRRIRPRLRYGSTPESEQLVIPLASADAVRRVAPRADLLLAHGRTGQRAMAYVFAPAPGGSPASGDRAMVVRFFFPKHGAVVEDPGTGSACANLGGWLLATGAPLPQRLCGRPGRRGRPALPARARSHGRSPDPRFRARRRARPRHGDAVGFRPWWPGWASVTARYNLPISRRRHCCQHCRDTRTLSEKAVVAAPRRRRHIAKSECERWPSSHTAC